LPTNIRIRTLYPGLGYDPASIKFCVEILKVELCGLGWKGSLEANNLA